MDCNLEANRVLDIQTHLQLYHIGQAVSKLSKVADAPVATYSLSGRLYISKSGWLLLSVPNAMARGMFDALDENGIELPTKDGVFNAHISVMTKEEVDSLGGPDKITERGHTYLYQIGAIKTVRPAGWKEMSRVWFVDVKSPDLEALRKSYGLTPLPHGDHPFHVTIAVRRKNVLYDNELSKTSGDAPFEDSYRTELSQLAEIKADSDKRNYKAKHHKIRAMVAKKPKDWEVSNDKGHYSFKHKSGYKYHIPVAKVSHMLGELTKAAAIAPIGPARRKKKKKQPETHPLNPGGLAIGAGVLGGGALAGAYGMASDGQAQHLTDAIQRYKTPLAPYETGATRYQDIMSAGASMRPFGMPVGEIISGARSSPRIMSMAGTPDYVANKPGSFQEARMHYDSFRKGPIASYFHQLRAKGLYEPASPAFQPAAVGTAAPEKLTYDKLMQPKFEAAFKTWRAKQQKAPNGLLQGASGWLEPWEIDTAAVPHNAQLEFMRDYYEGLPADLKAERQRVETDKWGPGLANNANNYRPIIENGLSARNTLKDVGITASGAAGGAALGHYLHRLFAGNKKKKNQRDGLGYYASTLGGGALGGGAAYLLGTQHGSQTLQKLIGLLGQKKAASYLQKAIDKTPIKYDPNQTGLGNLARYTEQVQHSGNLMVADDNAAIDLGTSLNPARRRARFLSSLKGDYSTVQLTPAEKLVLGMPFRQLMGQ